MTLESFDEILTDRTSVYHKIDKGSYLAEGLFRIVDQGKTDIAGFTNDESLVVDSKRPIIIFGDHTRILKFVDFPLAIGADGVKVLHVSDRAIPKYVYYYLKSVRLPDAGYSRHFKFLKNVKIPIIALEDQARIAAVLSKAEGLIAQRKESVRLLDEFLKSTFLEMFGDPVKNEKDLPKQTLSSIGKLDRGVSKHRPRNAPELLGGPYPLIQTGDIANSGMFITNFSQTYSELGLKQSKLWKRGTLCITIAANIGKTAILDFDACFPDSVVGFEVDDKKAHNYYVYVLFEFLQAILEKNAPQAAQKNINVELLRNLRVLIPPLKDQIVFSKIVESIENLRTHFQESLAQLENLLNSLSQRAFKGELDLANFEVVLPSYETRVDHFEKIVEKPLKKVKGRRPKQVKEYGDPFDGKAIPEDRLMTLAEAKKILGNEYEEISDKQIQTEKIDSAWLQARTLPVNERGRIKFNNAEGWAILDAIFFERNFGFTSNEFMTFLQKEGIAFDSDTIANFFTVALDKKRIVQRYSKNTEVETGRTDSAKQENIIWFAHNVVDK